MESFSAPKLFGERPSVNLDKKIEELKASEISAVELSEDQRSEILSFEDTLGFRLESICETKSKNFRTNLEYIESEQGREDFCRVFGLAIPPEVLDQASVKSFLYNHEDVIKKTDSKTRGEFEGRSQAYFEKQTTTNLLATLSENGDIDPSVIIEPHDLSISLSPEDSLKKIKDLRELKQKLKEEYVLLEAEKGEVSDVKIGILNLYAKRLNEMLSGLSQTGIKFINKQAAGFELNETETELADMVFQVADSDRIASRYDKFERGASSELNNEGYYKQISSELTDFANKYAEEYNESIKDGDEQMRLRGLDPEKITDESMYGPEEVKAFAQEVLQAYDLLKSPSTNHNNSEEEGLVSDGKWRVSVSEKYNSMAVSGGQKVIKIPKQSYSVKKLFTVGLAHEIEGHVLQHTNKKKLGLRLFNKIGSDRSAIFAEGGAMYNQDWVSKEAFGVSSKPSPHYIRAMVTKLNGGNYADCVKTFFESAIEPYKEMKETNTITQMQFEVEAKKNIKLAVNRTRRIFRGGGDYESKKGLITSSKDSVYLEGLILTEKLQEAGLQKYMYLTQINIDAIIFLLKSGLLSTEDIKAPTYKTLEIWERVKGKFVLEKTS
jgi:hypothetical protein